MTMSLQPALRLAAILLVLLVAAGVLLYLRRRRAAARMLGDPDVIERLLGPGALRPPRLRITLIIGAALLLAAALADPRWGRTEEVRTGGPLILLLDASNSMLAADIAPTRLEAMRQTALQIVSEEEAPIGIVIFAGRAFALSPPTLDRGAIELYLSTLEPAMVTQTGSSLSAPLRQGIGLMAAGGGELRGGRMVLLTDGDTEEGTEELERTLALAARAGIVVHTVGIGTEGGAPVPDIDAATGAQVGFLPAESGGLAVSFLRTESLREIARTTGGEHHVVAAAADARRVGNQLSGSAGRSGADAEGRAPRYAWFAFGALLLLLLETVALAVRRVRK